MAQTKGRPTPKRSQARAARRQPVLPSARTSGAAARRGGTSTRAQWREAMRSGDERNYPPIAAGPERALVRDVVDDRRSFGWLALPGWFVSVILSVTPVVAVRALGSFLLFSLVGIVVGDSLAAARAVRRALAERWPDGTQVGRRSLVWYGVARNLQFRRQRLPRPRRWRGNPV